MESVDPDEALDAVLLIVRKDIAKLAALVDETDRVLTAEEARTASGYIRALADVVKDRRAAGKEKFGGRSLDELLEEARKVPELREMLERGE